MWRLLRAEANEDAVAIDLTTGTSHASIPAGAITLQSKEKGSAHGTGIAIIACAGAAADKTFTIKIYSWRYANGVAQRLASIACTTGTAGVVTYPHSGDAATDKFWVDTAVVTSYRGASVYALDNAGGNAITEIVVSNDGFDKIFAEISSADGVTGTEAANVSLYYTQF
jgi:hypothetical protein